MFTAIINGILAMSMVVSMTTTTIAATEMKAMANETASTVVSTAFHGMKTEEIVYDLATVWRDHGNMKIHLTNRGAKDSVQYEISSFSAVEFGGNYSIDFTVKDGTHMTVGTINLSDQL